MRIIRYDVITSIVQCHIKYLDLFINISTKTPKKHLIFCFFAFCLVVYRLVVYGDNSIKSNQKRFMLRLDLSLIALERVKLNHFSILIAYGCILLRV